MVQADLLKWYPEGDSNSHSEELVSKTSAATVTPSGHEMEAGVGVEPT